MSPLSGVGGRAALAATFLAAVFSSLPALCLEPALLPPALLDSGADEVLSRVVVPDQARRVGEVRLLARGGAVVVQTLLSSKVLERVVAEIRKKEESAWLPGSTGRADSERYVAALEALLENLESRQVAVTWAERRLRLLIEFVADDSGAGVVLGAWNGDEAGGALEPTERIPATQLALGRDYVLRNMRLILIDSFHIADADLDRLGALGPVRAVAAQPEAVPRALVAAPAGDPSPRSQPAAPAGPGAKP
ncbi:MAG: hypothetical protein HY899_12225 [Deltaproteobacteria bacterium]|nr:hypothetical protein [Deltaproteobacteria bacterium]